MRMFSLLVLVLASPVLAQEELKKPERLPNLIKVTIENVKPLALLKHKTKKTLAGAELGCRVVITNLGEKDFDFSPGMISVRLLDDKGNEFPLNHYEWNGAAHGDSGTYPIPKGKDNYKPILLTFVDDTIGDGSKYYLVASYFVLRTEPVKVDYVNAIKAIDMTGAKEKPDPPKE